MGLDELRLAQDARFDRVGEYSTRLGYKNLNNMRPIGFSTWKNPEGPSDPIDAAEAKPYTFTADADKIIYSVVVFLSRVNNDEYVVPRVTISINGEPVSSSCIASESINANNEAKEVIFVDAPKVHAGDEVAISLSAQSGELQGLNTLAYEDGRISGYINTATEGAISNVFEANIDGVKTVLFVHNEILYRMAENGIVTQIRQLPAGVKKVRFNQDLNQIRYVDGLEGPRLIDPEDNWSDTAIDVKDLQTDVTLNVQMSNIMDGVADNIIYFASDPDTEALWTYPYGYTFAKMPAFSTTATIQGQVGDTLTIALNTITPDGIAAGDWITGQGSSTAEVTSISGTTVNLKIVDTTPQTISSYDKFSTEFYQNFPAIKTGDPLTAMFNLGGVLYFLTRRNKYQMYAQSADSWSQSNSNAQNGTFSQESVVCDLNYAYFANENGIYIFDGSSEASLTENSIQNVYDNIPDKENIVLDLYKNRLYVYYTSKKGGKNDRCLVYNTNLRVWESFDSETYVSATSARQNSSSRFICGHSKIGILMLNEDVTDNDYSDMGKPISFNLETAYQHFGSTSQLKRITKWRPQFSTTSKPYTCECGYALDYTDSVKYAFSIDLQRQEVVNTGYIWDNPSDYGVPAIPTVHTTLPLVNGEFYRSQIRYQHIAAFEPVIFRSHTVTVQTQRIR